MSRLLEKLENNEFEIKLKTIDEQKLINGLQRIANRITLGLILAALIMAASNFITVPTEFEILDYPGLAIILLIGAVGGGVLLILSILIHAE